MEWLSENQTLVWWLVALSVAGFAATLALVPLVLLRMPADYFTRRQPPPGSWRLSHPAARAALSVVKNLVGLAFVVIGVLMLFWFGPGSVAILLGLSLMDIPGKRSLQERIIRQRAVRRTINNLRTKVGRPPLEIPGDVPP